ncbi:restriction endonuclease subunit S [Aeromonas veronii]
MSEVVVTPQQGLAGKYQPYPEYKVSGVEWIGDVPQSWEATKVKRWLLESPCYGVLKPDKYDGDDAVPLIRIMDVKADGTVAELETLESISPSLSIEYQRTLIRKGDLIVSVVGTLGRSFICDDAHERMNLSRALTRLQVCDLSTAKYLQYVINSKVFEDYVGVTCTGAAQKVLNLEDVSNWFVPSPPLVHRSTIVAFLDYETARLDRLIAQQQRLIELLKEKRQAVISHAVTKGLNPNAPMKDSGVEWLGQVPEHWLSNRVGWCCQVGNGCTPSRDNMDYWSEGAYPWLNSGKVNDGYIISAEQFVTVTALKECSLPKVPAGSIVMAITGEGKTRGSVAMTGIDTTLSQHLAFITVTSKKLSPMYLRIWLESQYQRIRFESEGWGSTKAAITCSDIKSYPLPEPPLNEQLKIVEYVGERSKTFDLLIQKSESMISVLQERRTALISAAVTGKIDLRGWTPPAEEAAA